MMLCNQLVRYIHTGYPCWHSSNKMLLAKLRKKTGYTFANCKKALELNEYDLGMAERWLQEQAQAMGWSKATKLEGRVTAQGLIAVAVEKRNAAIIEVNCETDFVARNKNFQTMVEAAATACIQFSYTQPLRAPCIKMRLDTERLKSLPGENGRTLADQLALVIGSVGENLSLRRATCFRVGEGVALAGYSHPAPASPAQIMLGKFGALVAFKEERSVTEDKEAGRPSLNEVGRQLCQHVVGMSPVKIGEIEVDVPANNPDDEHCMIYQEYLLDPSLSVSQVLQDAGVALLDFARYECGEEVQVPEQVPNLELAVEVGG